MGRRQPRCLTSAGWDDLEPMCSSLPCSTHARSRRGKPLQRHPGGKIVATRTPRGLSMPSPPPGLSPLFGRFRCHARVPGGLGGEPGQERSRSRIPRRLLALVSFHPLDLSSSRTRAGGRAGGDGYANLRAAASTDYAEDVARQRDGRRRASPSTRPTAPAPRVDELARSARRDHLDHPDPTNCTPSQTPVSHVRVIASMPCSPRTRFTARALRRLATRPHDHARCRPRRQVVEGDAAPAASRSRPRPAPAVILGTASCVNGCRGAVRGRPARRRPWAPASRSPRAPRSGRRRCAAPGSRCRRSS